MADRRQAISPGLIRQAPSIDRKISDTASQASTVTGAGQAAVETATGRPGRSPLRSAGKLLGPFGYGLDVIDGVTGYRADVKDGVPKRQALTNNGSRVAGGVVGGVIGGALLGPPGALVGSYGGGQFGELAPEMVSDTVRMARQLLRKLDAMEDPRYYRSGRSMREYYW